MNDEYPTFDDDFVKYYWQKRGISFAGTDYKYTRIGNGPAQQIEKDSMEF